MFLTCHCQHCNGGIEFDTDSLAAATNIIPCPHCGLETLLSLPQPIFVPVPLKESSLDSNLPSPIDDPYEGVKWFRKGAAIGDTESMAFLGIAYLEGGGVSQDFTEGVKWLRLAAERGHANAQVNLAFCYDSGYGVTQSFV